MKIKNWNQFIVNESFAMSTELFQFIKKNAIENSEFTDSLIQVYDIGAKIHISTHVVNQHGHIINVELEKGDTYKFNHTIRINYITPKSGKLEEFYKIQENLNTISICIQEMISRVSDKVKLIHNEFETIISMTTGHQETNHYFALIFQSDVNSDELKKSYDQYLKTTEHTPEFNKGILELTKYYKERGCELNEYLDTLNEKDLILVGFVTEDEIYPIAVYYKSDKKFVIDWGEVDSAFEAWMEEN